MSNKFRLDDNVALITGGGSGIGFEIARQFLSAGCQVVITGRTISKLKKAKKELGENCHVIQNDVTHKSKHPALVHQIESEIGKLDILVNNAGMHHKIPSIDVTDEEYQAIIDTNLNSVFSLSREALKAMVPRQKGSIINISSMTAIYGMPMVAAYSSSKTALLGLTRSLAVEYSPSGVRINTIAPGFIESEMLFNAIDQDSARKQRIMSRTPMNRLGKPEEIGYAAVFLASDASQFVTGICLPIDGGNSIGF